MVGLACQNVWGRWLKTAKWGLNSKPSSLMEVYATLWSHVDIWKFMLNFEMSVHNL